MSRYLLAAEADKIQDLVHRSARLGEVAGASQLLTRFCSEVPRASGIPERDIIIGGAGSFRILFDTKQDAEDFGEVLTEIYAMVTGGSLSVGDPVAIGEDFKAANWEAHSNLRLAKRWQSEVKITSTWHSHEQMPYVALCSSCGEGLAVTYSSRYADEQAGYLCQDCLTKGLENPFHESSELLSQVFRDVEGDPDFSPCSWPGKGSGAGERDPLGDLSRFDARGHVAYLVADGNSVGDLFKECGSPRQMRDLSCSLKKAFATALAEPARELMKNQPHEEFMGTPEFIPILPLILGGDDLFALIPAPWALDYAYRFCKAYERQMAAELNSIGFGDMPQPTISAAVVIVKSTHPYYLAYRAGQARLSQAKHVCRQFASEWGEPVSAISFQVVTGGHLLSEPKGPTNRGYNSTLQPYLVLDRLEGVAHAKTSSKIAAYRTWGVSPGGLIRTRKSLNSIPGTRLAALAKLFDSQRVSELGAETKMMQWKRDMDYVLERLHRSPEQESPIIEALKTLGSSESYYWRDLKRPEYFGYFHGLPDLLEMWDFALDMDEPQGTYQGGR